MPVLADASRLTVHHPEAPVAIFCSTNRFALEAAIG